MVKIIIIEGPDGSGKTTLVNMLKEELGIGVAPRVVSKETNAMTDLQAWVDDNLDGGLVPTIFDRHRLISEPIYGPLIRGTAQPGFSELHWLAPRLKRLYLMKPIIIYCLPPLEEVMANLENDPDNASVVKKTEAIYQAYVNKVAIDLMLAPRAPLVWNYKASPTISGKPAWLNQVRNYVNELITEKSTTLW